MSIRSVFIRYRGFLLLAIMYSLFMCISVITPQSFVRQFSDLRPFWTNDEITTSLTHATMYDWDTRTLIITRILHNKITAHIQYYFATLYDIVDPIFLFSLGGRGTLYGDIAPIHLGFWWEFIGICLVIIIQVTRIPLHPFRVGLISKLVIFTLLLQPLSYPTPAVPLLLIFLFFVRIWYMKNILESIYKYLWRK